jgi:hydroxysqualene dehydroxylase
LKVAVIGAGWAGCAAAVEATRRGHTVTVFEAARIAGGRARRVDGALNGAPARLDNGQHVLIGAYTETLALMASVGIDETTACRRLTLNLRFADGSGLRLPNLPAPLDALAGIMLARGWSLTDKLSLLRAALAWRRSGFSCPQTQSVADLCRGIRPAVMKMLIEALCVSALNTPAERASGQVFLRVLHDSMFSPNGGSNLLLPRIDLSAMLPDAALHWLSAQGGESRLGARVQSVSKADLKSPSGWLVTTDRSEPFDRVVIACPVAEAMRLAQQLAQQVEASGPSVSAWLGRARALQHEALTTVYAFASGAANGRRLPQPMLALRSDADHPAQFVFDRGQLGGPPGLLAFVISASSGEGAALASQVVAQAARQLGLEVEPVQTIVEKRATFSCTPGLQRPPAQIAAGLLACGDYVDGPYPATLEGAVRSGLHAARNLEG